MFFAGLRHRAPFLAEVTRSDPTVVSRVIDIGRFIYDMYNTVFMMAEV